MGIDFRTNKGFRLLGIYETLSKGNVVTKTKLANQYQVTEKTIQRDIDDLRAYLLEAHTMDGDVSISYDRKLHGYRLIHVPREWLTCKEALATCKILLESRAFCKEELDPLLRKLVMQVPSDSQNLVKDMIGKEQFYYIPLRHKKKLLDILWKLSDYIKNKEIIRISYCRKDGVEREHEIKPVAILFSEFYFYLIGFMLDESKTDPTIFRVDRLLKIEGTGQPYYIKYSDKFNEGEFRKRVQFMYAGELRRVTFLYSGPSIEAVLDRLPTAKIMSSDNGIYTVRAEVYGNGIDMWLRSQGDYVKIITPEDKK